MNAGAFAVLETAPSWIQRSRFDDIDAQAAQLQGYGQHYIQLSPGRFEGSFASCYLQKHLSLHFERANRALAQSGRSPGDRYTACFLAADSPSGLFDGVRMTPDDIMIWPPGHFWEALTPPGLTICVTDLDCGLLENPDRATGRARVMRDPTATERLRLFVDTGLSELRAHPQATRHAAASQVFAATLGGLLPDPQRAMQSVGTTLCISARQRWLAFRRIRDAIHQDLSQGVCVGSLCSRLAMSRRKIETVFASVSGTSPAHYINVMRLNAIRRALLSEDYTGWSIGDIVARWGVWHLSRFAGDYRKMFGELPSHTRRNAGFADPHPREPVSRGKRSRA